MNCNKRFKFTNFTQNGNNNENSKLNTWSCIIVESQIHTQYTCLIKMLDTFNAYERLEGICPLFFYRDLFDTNRTRALGILNTCDNTRIIVSTNYRGKMENIERHKLKIHLLSQTETQYEDYYYFCCLKCRMQNVWELSHLSVQSATK